METSSSRPEVSPTPTQLSPAPVQERLYQDAYATSVNRSNVQPRYSRKPATMLCASANDSRSETSFLPAFASSSFAASRESPDASASSACSRIGPNVPLRTQAPLAPAPVQSCCRIGPDANRKNPFISSFRTSQELCNNCGKCGHMYKHCKLPITSNGVILFRFLYSSKPCDSTGAALLSPAPVQAIQYLMICRKDTLGYVDFLRGKYNVNDTRYVLNMILQMTEKERNNLLEKSFNELWSNLWSSDVSADSFASSSCVGVGISPTPSATFRNGLSVPEWSKAAFRESPDASARQAWTGAVASGACVRNGTSDRECSRIGPAPELSGATTLENANEPWTGAGANVACSHIGPLPASVKSGAEKLDVNENNQKQHKVEEFGSRKKFFNLRNTGVLAALVNEANQIQTWTEPEWGFPKGRRNNQEKDFECAIRELKEETGFSLQNIKPVKNIMPFEEVFSGSNYKSYKHKYFLVMYEETNNDSMNNFERGEVSDMKWKTYDECIRCIRHYNVEKLRMIEKVNATLTNYAIHHVINNDMETGESVDDSRPEASILHAKM